MTTLCYVAVISSANFGQHLLLQLMDGVCGRRQLKGRAAGEALVLTPQQLIEHVLGLAEKRGVR